MSEIEESAKAITETAKLGTTVVEATEKMGGFLSHILNEPITEAVGIFGDKLKFMRWKRKLRIVDEVNRILDERGVESTRPIPPKLAIPILEQASLEENDELQDIWCRLIANSLDPNFLLEIRYAFIDIIKNLTPLDAKVLKYVYESTIEINKLNQTARFIAYPIDFYQIVEHTRASYTETELSLNNLQRVQCLWDNDIRDFHPEVKARLTDYPLSPLDSSKISKDLEFQHFKISKDLKYQIRKQKENDDELNNPKDLKDLNRITELKKEINKRLDCNTVYLPTINKDSQIKHSRFKITPLGYAFIKACVK